MSFITQIAPRKKKFKKKVKNKVTKIIKHEIHK